MYMNDFEIQPYRYGCKELLVINQRYSYISIRSIKKNYASIVTIKNT